MSLLLRTPPTLTQALVSMLMARRLAIAVPPLMVKVVPLLLLPLLVVLSWLLLLVQSRSSKHIPSIYTIPRILYTQIVLIKNYPTIHTPLIMPINPLHAHFSSSCKVQYAMLLFIN